jgi:hypothetical protein
VKFKLEVGFVCIVVALTLISVVIAGGLISIQGF